MIRLAACGRWDKNTMRQISNLAELPPKISRYR